MTKLTKMAAIAGLILALIGSAVTLAATSEIRDRIKPSADVRVGEGVERGVDEDAARPGDAVYAAACAACHDSGAAGAPRIGRAGDWGDRLDQDTETLYDHAINGIGSMPAKGGCRDCSDEEVRAAVDHMLDET